MVFKSRFDPDINDDIFGKERFYILYTVIIHIAYSIIMHIISGVWR